MKKIFGTLLVCTATFAVTAHELPDISLHSKESVAVATSFTMSEGQINSTYNNHAQFFEYNSWLNHRRAEKGMKPVLGETCGNQMNTVKTCGQVDNFYIAAMVGTSMCNSYALLHASSYPDGLTARFTAPSSFVDGLEAADGHHEYYDIAQGISFECVYTNGFLPAPAPITAEPKLKF